MKSYAVAAGLAAIVQSAYAQGSAPTINTPAAYVQCQPVSLTFSGGVAPYFLAVLPGGMPSAVAIEQLPEQTAAGSYAWTVNVAAGTNITLRITDSQGNVNYNSARVVQASSDSSCLGTSASAAPTSSGASTATATTLVSSAPSATVTASSGPLPTNVTTNNGTTTSASNYNFTCAQGLLTYGITTASLRGVSLKKASTYFGNWPADAPGATISSSGTGVGATRSYTLGGNITIAETLITNQTNATTGALHQQWNFTTAGAVALTNGLTIYNAFDDLTVYTNDTTNTTSVQYFILGCFNNQTAGLTALAQIIQLSVTQWSANITATRGSRRAIAF